MDQPTNFNFLISNDASLRQSTKTAVKIKCKPKIYKKGRRKCNECDKERLHLDESHQICHTCYKANTIFKLSGNKVIDDFIRRTQIGRCNGMGRMEWVSYDQFKDVQFIAKGGFSTVYEAIWIEGPIKCWNNKKQKYDRNANKKVALKKLNNSNNLTSKELNEVHKIPYLFYLLYMY